jgi:excisionase family DNA binding protein
MDEDFLTVAEVAGLLRLNQQTVRNWIEKGSLPAVRVGRRVRIKRSDLDRILETGANDAETGDTHNDANLGSRTQEETAQAAVARNRFAAALAEIFRVAARPDSSDLTSALHALANASENFAAALDPESQRNARGRKSSPQGADDPVTHRVTAKDIMAGLVRIPPATKELFPPVRGEFGVRVRGTLLTAHWDPRVGSERPRAGLLRFGRRRLEPLVGENDILAVSVDDDGVFELT